ncbi:MAG TPA: hypothetical protein IAA26_14215 [Candidatus Blautia faecipullorum]|nr:hypothetical protein [Candidatus Blautia faecipullorum]
MQSTKEKGKKILVTMIGARPAVETEYAFFDSCISKNHKKNGDIYRKKDGEASGSSREKYGYPFWAKIKALAKEECYDQIVFIGTQGSKWESLLTNAEKVAGKVQARNGQSNRCSSELSGNEKQMEALELMNQYVSRVLGNDYDKVTERVLPQIENYMKGLLTPEARKREKEKEDQKKHLEYMQRYMSEEHLHEYEEQLSRNITAAVRETDGGPLIKARVILIKEGRAESENRENIIKIQEELSKIPISEITLDVTNGLRSHPLYVLSIINNISAIGSKAIPVNIYYGMFDAKLKAENGNEDYYVVPINPWEGQIAPMVDLKEIQTIDQWTRAVSEFFSNGSVLQIIELLEAINNEEKSQSPIKGLINAFESFSLAVNSNNLLVFEEAMEKIEQSRRNEEQIELPIYVKICLQQIITHLWEQFKVEEAEEQTKYSFYMFKLGNWYLKQNRLGDSVRTFQEAVVTYVMEKYPDKISKLLEMKLIKWPIENKKLSDFLFDAKIRKVIRDAVFEDDFVIKGREEEYRQWKKWSAEYHYMKEHIHNPDALLYNLKQSEENPAQEGTVSENGIKAAKNAIKSFSKKMPRGVEMSMVGSLSDSCDMLAERIDYLLDIRYYDVFISYRRTYHRDGGKELNDGVLLVTALCDYFEKNGLHVFYDKPEMEGKQGEFSPYLQHNLLNSKLCLIVLGKNAYARDFSETDEYYKEIITAVKNKKKIAVICMEDFYMDGRNSINYGNRVGNIQELKNVVEKYQRIGSEFADRWKYENILSLRECAYKEIKQMLEEE